MSQRDDQTTQQNQDDASSIYNPKQLTRLKLVSIPITIISLHKSSHFTVTAKVLPSSENSSWTMQIVIRFVCAIHIC